MAKKKKQIKTKGRTIRQDVIFITSMTKKPMTSRELLEAVNKSRKLKDRVSMFGVRRIISILSEDKTITVTKKGKSILIAGKKKGR